MCLTKAAFKSNQAEMRHVNYESLIASNDEKVFAEILQEIFCTKFAGLIKNSIEWKSQAITKKNV